MGKIPLILFSYYPNPPPRTKEGSFVQCNIASSAVLQFLYFISGNLNLCNHKLEKLNPSENEHLWTLPWHPLALINKQDKTHNYPHHGLPKVESGEAFGERFWTRGTSLPRDRLTRGMPGDPGVGFQGGSRDLERTFSFSSFRGLQDRIAHPAYSIDSPASWRIKEIGISCL